MSWGHTLEIGKDEVFPGCIFSIQLQCIYDKTDVVSAISCLIARPSPLLTLNLAMILLEYQLSYYSHSPYLSL